MRRRAVAVLVPAVLTALAWAPAARAETRTVGTSMEAWYATLPPLGSRAPDTLHVGVLAGLEESRTYLTLDLTGIEGEPTGGRLVLPVDEAGSQAPESAEVQVCLAGSPGPSVAGSTDTPPPVDCSVSAPAAYGDGAFTADLAPFVAVMRTTGVALVPVSGGTATWHVSLWGRDNDSPDARPVTATLELPDAPPAVTGGAPIEPSSPSAVDTGASPGLPVFAAPDTGFSATQAPEVAPAPLAGGSDPDAATGSPVASPPVAVSTATGRYADSVVFALPLLALVLVGFVGSALTRPVELPPAPQLSPAAGLPVRRGARLRARVAREPRASGSAVP